jgi:NADPH:quinone reductase-like Zn-dependent oxidoreductase
MRAVTLDAVPAAPQITEVAGPRPPASEVLVKVAASSVNGSLPPSAKRPLPRQ